MNGAGASYGGLGGTSSSISPSSVYGSITNPNYFGSGSGGKGGGILIIESNTILNVEGICILYEELEEPYSILAGKNYGKRMPESGMSIKVLEQGKGSWWHEFQIAFAMIIWLGCQIRR